MIHFQVILQIGNGSGSFYCHTLVFSVVDIADNTFPRVEQCSRWSKVPRHGTEGQELVSSSPISQVVSYCSTELGLGGKQRN